MKFFTPEWASGQLSDDEFDAAPSQYSVHLANLQLPGEAEALSRTNLHDALVVAVRSSADALALVLVTGDLQRGYFETTIIYTGSERSSVTLSLLERSVGNTEVEVIADEVDRGEGHFLHRLLFSSLDQAEVRFSSVSLAHLPRRSRDLMV
jgi:hypothetical protein